jgi:hypothetical protein
MHSLGLVNNGVPCFELEARLAATLEAASFEVRTLAIRLGNHEASNSWRCRVCVSKVRLDRENVPVETVNLRLRHPVDVSIQRCPSLDFNDDHLVDGRGGLGLQNKEEVDALPELVGFGDVVHTQ